jgi:hypothetical protein
MSVVICIKCDCHFGQDTDEIVCDECSGVVIPEVFCSLCAEYHEGGCWGSTARPIKD